VKAPLHFEVIMQVQARYVTKIDPKKLAKLPIINKEDGSRKIDEKEEKYLRELVTYEFMNLEQQGHPEAFSYQGHNFEFLHGGRYLLPRFIAQHVESLARPDWGWKPNGKGDMEKNLNGNLYRFQMREVRD